MANPVQGVGGGLSAAQIEIAGAAQAAPQSITASSRATAVASQQQPTDATDLSALGSLLGSAVKLASAQTSFRAGLVSSLKAQIAAGSYRPDPDMVAARVAAGIKP
jgi:hypothetical protein